jgi:pimeloyl-ACP methyl ester carboxylesterase
MKRTVLGLFGCVLAVLFIAAGCASSFFTADRVYRLARNAGFQRRIVEAGRFQVVVYLKAAAQAAQRVHVYIEGDGTPWIRHRRVARNPTPRNPLALKLMQLDPNPSLYLGRPCYHGLHNMPSCDPRFWTSDRYSEAVVESMAIALKALLAELSLDDAVLIGHSGGGTLAMLLAARIPMVRAVITVAANLDTDAWAAYHHYLPLHRSLNPARLEPLPPRIFQLHLAGKEDVNVPPNLIRPVVERQHNARWQVVRGQNHTCCWEALWPAVLAAVPAAKDNSSDAAVGK